MNGMSEGQWRVPGYTEVRELGRGAAGRVVLAQRDHDGTEVAIKYLSDDLRHDVGFVARFRHEARLLNTMRSPYNARLIDYVESGGGAAIVMELVNGVPLRALLNSEGPTGPEAALCVLQGALKGLAAAHAIGVVHRDFKPENVVVQGDGTSKLIDFGIAVRHGEGTSAAGTPPYMAPEQWQGGAASPATDVYAATVVFFECLTGTRPFRASNLAALAHQHQSTPPPIEEVPAPLQGLVERGMAKQATERPPSAEAFLTELQAIAADAYGPDWEERGHRRLARLAGLLLVLFPSAEEAPLEVNTSLGETHLGGPSKLMTKLGVKILVGTVAIGVITGVTVVLLNSSDDEPTLQAQTSNVSPTAVVPLTEPVTEEPVAEETPTPTAEESTPTAEPTTTTSAAAPTQSATPTPTPKVTKKATPTPTPTKTPKASQSPEPSETVTLDGDETEPPATQSATPTPTPTPVITTPPPSAEPTRTPPTQTTSPTISKTSDETKPTTTPTPSPTPEKVPAALLAVGLVTSGAVPVTLAVKRRMAGRHRRKR